MIFPMTINSRFYNRQRSVLRINEQLRFNFTSYSAPQKHSLYKSKIFLLFNIYYNYTEKKYLKINKHFFGVCVCACVYQ